MANPLRIIFFGTPDFSLPRIRQLHESSEVDVCVVVTQPDKPAGRGNKLRESPVKRYAVENGIGVLQPKRIKKSLSEFLSSLEVFEPLDLGVVIAFGQILPQEVLDFPKSGCVNVHASLLPRWRGAAPIHRAIMQGDRETGVCLMQMDVGLDTGAVYSSARTAIGPRATTGELHDELATLGADLLAKDITPIVTGELQATPQPDEGVTYAHKIGNAEAEINWSQPAEQIDRQVRGLSPFPGAFTGYNDKRLKLFMAEPKPSIGSIKKFAPGQVALVDRDRLEVQCKDALLSLKSVQLEGKRRMQIDEFLRGHPIQPGLQLGVN